MNLVSGRCAAIMNFAENAAIIIFQLVRSPAGAVKGVRNV